METLDLHIDYDEGSDETAEVTVCAKVGGEEHPFIVDTGCARSLLTGEKLAGPWKVVGSDEGAGVFGGAPFDLIEVDEISLGSITWRDRILCRPQSEGVARNLLGMDLLQDQCLHFLFSQSQLKVLEAGEVPPQNWWDITFQKGRIPQVTLEYEGIKAGAVWDSGAGVTLVDAHFLDHHRDLFTEMGTSPGMDSSGRQMDTPMYRIEPIQIGGHTFAPHLVVAVDLSHINERLDLPIDFILGFSTLRRAHWIFDFPGERWAITEMVEVKI